VKTITFSALAQCPVDHPQGDMKNGTNHLNGL
jgi:hypothetical protein